MVKQILKFGLNYIIKFDLKNWNKINKIEGDTNFQLDFQNVT